MRKSLFTLVLIITGPLSWSQTIEPSDILQLAKKDYGYEEFKTYGESLGLKRLEDENHQGNLIVKFETKEKFVLKLRLSDDETTVSFFTPSSTLYDRLQEELDEQAFMFQNAEEFEGNRHRLYTGPSNLSKKVTVRLSKYGPAYGSLYCLEIRSDSQGPFLGKEQKDVSDNDDAVKEYDQKGIIVRDEDYWNEYAGIGYELQAIHNGDKSFSHGPSFEMIYLFYLKTYYKDCGIYLPKGSPGFETVTTSQFQDGSTSENVTSVIRMKPKFIDKYKEFSNSYNPTLMRPELYKTTMNMIIDIQREVLMLYSEEGCNSGFMRQFEENLYRIANRLETVQEDSSTYDFTVDEPAKKERRETLFTVCLDDQRKNGNIGPREKKWCKCISDSFTARLSESELEKYIRDYDQFYRDKGMTPNENKNNSWENYEAWARCTKR